MYPKIYIGPMSKNIVDAAVELSEIYPIGFIPSRRQIDYASGYVNDWTTQTFRQYVPKHIIVERDHGGPGQGAINDGGNISFQTDALNCDIIHIDPWKAYPDFADGMDRTIDALRFIYGLNSDIEFEVGTEEAIRFFKNAEYTSMLQWLKQTLPSKMWKRISYVVVQSGTGLDLPNQINTGIFNEARLKSQLETIKYRGKLAKEHNGDYLSAKDIQMRFKLGVDAINIAPEIGQYETEALMEAGDNKFRKQFLDECVAHINMFSKWLPFDFNFRENVDQFVLTGGHYVISKLKDPPKVYDEVKERLRKRLDDIYA